MIRETHSVEETEQLASELAQDLRGGECLCLSGELGAGKTQFVRGLVRGLGGAARTVSSPTFVLLNVYDSGRLTVFHVDAYRLRSDDEAGFSITELLQQGGVVVVEWPERIASQLPEARISVAMAPIGIQSRRVDIRAGD